MSTKFEKLLDLIVNEEMDKANELFHEIVVEKSREIYENLIAEEAEEEEMDEAADEEMDESADEEEMDESADEEEMDESADEEEMDEAAEEEADESMDLEDSYSMEADDEGPMGGDATDDFGADVDADDDMGGDEGPEGQEDQAIFDIKNAIQELEAAFAELEKAQGGEEEHDFGDEEGDEEGDDDDMMMGKPAMEGRRMTREYTEKVGHDWDKGSSQKAQAQYVGAGTGDKEGGPVEGKSPVSSGSGKPTSGATAKNVVQGSVEGQSNTGTSPGKVTKGINPVSGEKFAKGMHNVDGVKSGVKTLGKVSDARGLAAGKSAGTGNEAPKPVGSGTGDKAGQTSVGQVKSPINGAPGRAK